MKILLIFTLCLISDGGASKEVTGYSGGRVLIKCKYDTGYTPNPKYFCKGSSPGCSDQIKTGDKNEWVNSGRFSLFDDTESAEFRVMIRELTVQDTGTYHCGVDRTLVKDIYTAVELKVKEGDLVSTEVRAYAGGRINIKCRYEDEYKDKPKSFCKNGADQSCFNQITKLNSEWSHDGRFSIHDNRSAGFFSVLIRDLITEDTGTYSCAVVVSDEIETYTVVKLNVTEDLSYEKSINKTVHVGGDLNISCKYPKSLRGDPKFLCKTRWQQAACFYKESVKESRKYVNVGKFSLYDDRAEQIFTVGIRNVTEQDSGEYWCGAEGAGTSDHGSKVYFTQINLRATDPRVPVSNLKPKQHSSSSSSSEPTAASPPPGFPASILIPVSVILLLFLIGISFVFVILQRRRKMRAGRAATGRSFIERSGNDQEYEEIKDTGRLSASDAGTFADFSSARLPTISSDPQTIYTEIPTSPCDSLVYSTVQLPTIPCDQDIYSTAQLPTCVSVEKSPESLNYATVRFHTKATGSNDGVPPIIFKKEELSCDSASVNHVTSSG